MRLQYRLRKTLETIAGQKLWVECLEDLNQTIDSLFEELERSGNASLLEELCPYFGTIWPSARALAETLASRQRSMKGKRVLELGCGLALPSMVAARMGAAVTATDFHPEVPVFLERNLALNAIGGVKYVRVDWKSESPELGLFDWVIGSDVLYEKEHAQSLAQVASQYLAPHGTVLIADPARPYLQAFTDRMTELGFESSTQVCKVPDQPVPKEIFLIQFERMASETVPK